MQRIKPFEKALDHTLPPGADRLVITFQWDAFYRFFGQHSKRILILQPTGKRPLLQQTICIAGS